LVESVWVEECMVRWVGLRVWWVEREGAGDGERREGRKGVQPWPLLSGPSAGG
jgi:hypothetical protein